MEVSGVLCTVCAIQENQRIMELHIEPAGTKSILNNIYVGQVETVSSNIKAAFVRFQDGQNGYFPLAETENAIFTSGRKGDSSLRPGDEILVQINRDAMKGKLPSLTSDLNFTGKYMVFTIADKKLGISSKLLKEDKERLYKWVKETGFQEKRESDNLTEESFGIIVRTNAAEASREAFMAEYDYLLALYKKVAVYGRNRTCGSLLYKNPRGYMNVLRDQYMKDLEEVITDVPEIYHSIQSYYEEVSPDEMQKLRLYEDKLLSLYKLYSIESAVQEIYQEKVWLKSGGFLVIQQTEAFVSIDVNSGKFTGKKKAEETYRKINLEAAEEIARQLRLRNLSGIILIDFINMSNTDHQDELFHVLQKHLRRDSVKSKAVDITPLHILEMTRKKVRRPLIEDLRELGNMKF